jgi:growth hormone-inducible transmembrane protein
MVTEGRCVSLWPEYVKERIKETYLYIGGSLAIAAGSAIVCIRMPIVANAMIRHPWLVISPIRPLRLNNM